MTPANPDALADARELVRQSLKGGGPGLTDATREAIVRSIMLKLEGKVLAPILAAKEAAEARAAQLQAEVEAKDRRIAVLEDAMEPFARFGNLATPDTAETWAGVRHTARISTRFRHEHFRAARTALAARAATAREGQAEEATEDADFAIVYRTARCDMDFEQMARVLSARLRQMDKRAKAANQRADAAEARIGAPGTD